MSMTLQFVSEGRAGVHIGIGDRELLVGRGEAADVRLDSASISRLHARLRRSGDVVEVHDLGSQNGTYVNGARISKPTTVRPGDRLQLGTVVLRLERAPAATATDQTGAVSFTVDDQSAGEIWNVGGDVVSNTITDDEPWDELFQGTGAGRAMMAIGLVAVIAGFALWIGFIFTGFSPPTGSDAFNWNPFADGPQILGLPQPVLGFLLFAGGGITAGVGSGISRAARRRRDDVHRMRLHTARRRA